MEVAAAQPLKVPVGFHLCSEQDMFISHAWAMLPTQIATSNDFRDNPTHKSPCCKGLAKKQAGLGKTGSAAPCKHQSPVGMQREDRLKAQCEASKNTASAYIICNYDHVIHKYRQHTKQRCDFWSGLLCSLPRREQDAFLFAYFAGRISEASGARSSLYLLKSSSK